jgi:hypothetical protein
MSINQAESIIIGTENQRAARRGYPLASVFVFWVPFACWMAQPVSAAPNAEQELMKGVVKITSQAEGIKRIGTGVIVSVKRDAAYIVTVSHVIAGDPSPKVTFFVDQERPMASEIIGIDTTTPNGTAVLKVHGSLPVGIQALILETGHMRGKEAVLIIGFPRKLGIPWYPSDGKIAGQVGADLKFTGEVDEGNSGGPVLHNGKIVGIVTSVYDGVGHSLPAPIVRSSLYGYKEIKDLATPEASPAPPNKRETAIVSKGLIHALKKHYEAVSEEECTLTLTENIAGVGPKIKKIHLDQVHPETLQNLASAGIIKGRTRGGSNFFVSFSPEDGSKIPDLFRDAVKRCQLSHG